MFEIRYAEIPDRLLARRPTTGFNLEDLFTHAEWREIGDGSARQRFGRQFSRDVSAGAFPAVTRNETPNEPGGNEARYDYHPEAEIG